MLLCYDRKTGKLLWEKVARVATPHEGYHPRYGSFASNSPITDGKHVIAFFGSRGVYCYTLAGELVWEKDLMPLHMNNNFGEGAWPALDGDKLVLVLDQMGDSFLLALDKSTGKELWRTPRQGATNWSGPLITSHNNRKQVIVSATQKVAGYDLETGKPIWEATGLGANTIPAPVAADGMVFAMSGFRNPNLMAIRLGREGDLTAPAIVWQNQRRCLYPPVLYQGALHATDNGCCRASMPRPEAVLPAGAVAQAVQLQGTPDVNGSHLLGGRRCDRGEDGEKFEVLAAIRSKAIVHRHAGDWTVHIWHFRRAVLGQPFWLQPPFAGGIPSHDRKGVRARATASSRARLGCGCAELRT
jgi:outer membrane protein assembly factor BamB